MTKSTLGGCGWVWVGVGGCGWERWEGRRGGGQGFRRRMRQGRSCQLSFLGVLTLFHELIILEKNCQLSFLIFLN